MNSTTLFCFGLGYTGVRLAQQALSKGWRVGGSCRSTEKAEQLKRLGIDAFVFDGNDASVEIRDFVRGSEYVLNSVPPVEGGDPVLHAFADDIAASSALKWFAYLSTTGVYGDCNGDWVNEETPPNPQTEGNQRRLEVEEQWSAIGASAGLPVHIFRLPGIYGPNGRSYIDSLRSGSARRIVKQGQLFNRAHVDDITATLFASMDQPSSGGRVFNIADDEPAQADVVMAYAAQLLGITPPPEEMFDEIELPPFARHFYLENRRVDNSRIKKELGVQLRYPSFREGLQACVKPLS